MRSRPPTTDPGEALVLRPASRIDFETARARRDRREKISPYEEGVHTRPRWIGSRSVARADRPKDPDARGRDTITATPSSARKTHDGGASPRCRRSITRFASSSMSMGGQSSVPTRFTQRSSAGPRPARFSSHAAFLTIRDVRSCKASLGHARLRRALPLVRHWLASRGGCFHAASELPRCAVCSTGGRAARSKRSICLPERRSA